MGWLTRLFGGSSQDGPFADGAAVAVMAHPSGIILHPITRLKTQRGFVSTQFMPVAVWSKVDAAAAPGPLGAELRAAFGRVETLTATEWKTRAAGLTDKAGQGFDSATYRDYLNLPKRAAVWADMRSVTVRAGADGLEFAASEAQGVPGGFAGFTPPRSLTCPLDGSDDLIGQTLTQAIGLCA